MKKRKLIKCLSLICLAALLLCGCAGQEARTLTGFALDTVVSLTVFDGDEAALSQALALCNDLERRLSRTVADSEIARANAAGGEPVELSADTAALIEKALYYAELSGGLFDVTVCPLTDLWDFKADHPAVPAAEDIEAALACVGWERVQLSGTQLRLTGGARIDLGGIAKGYIADRVAQSLAAAGKERALVNLGGNVVVFGGREDGEPFTVGIQKPFAAGGELALTLCLSDGAVATSGSYERCFWQQEELFHHILHPQTGMPARTGLASVTVIAKSSVDADALSTVCFLLGQQAGLELINGLSDTEAVFISEQGEIVLSEGLRRGEGFVTIRQ